MELVGLIDPKEREDLDRLRSLASEAELIDLDEIMETFARVGLSVPPVPPPERIRARLLDRIRRRGFDVSTIRGNQGWRPYAIPGSHFKELTREKNRVSIALRLEPGASLPSHRHRDEETTYMVEGTIEDAEGHVWHAGDFVLAPSGSEHGPFTTRDGCTAILTMAIEDFRDPITI